MKKISTSLVNDVYRQERNYPESIKKQIENEQLKYKTAILNNASEEALKETKDRIKFLRSFLKSH